jgi:hypothetical protein
MCKSQENVGHRHGTKIYPTRSIIPSHREPVSLAALNPNPLAASNCHNVKPKPKGGRKFENWKKARPISSSGDGRLIICFSCNKQEHKKSECSEKKEENVVNAGAARGKPVAMAAQENHCASMAQLVESSMMLSAIKWESKKLWLMMVSQVRFAQSVWMTNFHPQQGGGHNWLKLIKITVPSMIRLGPLNPHRIFISIAICPPRLPWISMLS